jgi:hypothetical protein
MMVLKSPLHTTSGTAGSGIYLETLFPVVQDNKVTIPAHTFVEGVVEGNRRPGHLHRTSDAKTELKLKGEEARRVAGLNALQPSIQKRTR